MISASGKQISFLLGKPVRPTTIFPEVFDRLRAAGAKVTVNIPDAGGPLPATIGDNDLIVQRGLKPSILSRALHVEQTGTQFCNPVAATIAVADRALAAQTLARHDIPIPGTSSAATWPQVIELAEGQPLVVKAADGSVGRGSGVLIAETGSLSCEPPFAGPYIVQDFIASDGDIYKLYVAGHQTQGLIKRLPVGSPGVPFEIDTEMAALARRVGSALNLEIFGIDILAGPAGPVIVDVNPFPGFRGVPHAARMIAEHLTTI